MASSSSLGYKNNKKYSVTVHHGGRFFHPSNESWMHLWVKDSPKVPASTPTCFVVFHLLWPRQSQTESFSQASPHTKWSSHSLAACIVLCCYSPSFLCNFQIEPGASVGSGCSCGGDRKIVVRLPNCNEIMESWQRWSWYHGGISNVGILSGVIVICSNGSSV